MKDLKLDLQRWVDGGLITAEQAASILAVEEGEKPPEEKVPPSVSRATAALAFLGGSVAIVGVFVAASRYWSNLGAAARLGLVGAVTALLLVGGWLAHRAGRPGLRPLAGFLWLLSAAGVAFFVGLTARDALDLNMRTAFLLAGLATAACGFALWRVRPAAMQEIPVFFGLALAVEAAIHHLPGPPSEYAGLPLWGLGAIWLVLAWGGFQPGRRSAFALGCVGLLIGAEFLAASRGGPGLGVGIATAIGLMAASMALGSMLLLGFGAAGVLLFLPQIVFKYFGDTLGAPLALVTIGAALLGGALLTARLKGAVQTPRLTIEVDRRRRFAALLAAGVALAVMAVIWAFGVAPLPDYRELAEKPNPGIPGEVAFVRWDGPCLYTVPAAGGREREILCGGSPGTALPGFDGPIAWTDDGRILVMAFGSLGPHAIVVDPARGRPAERIRLEEMPPSGFYGDRWGNRMARPDGTRIRLGFGFRDEATVAIQPREAATREILRVDGPYRYGFAEGEWSPDGAWLLLKDTKGRLIIVTAREGAAPRLLAERVSGPFAWRMPGVPTYSVNLDSLRSASEERAAPHRTP